MFEQGFLSEKQELFWKAFKGECGSEFAGNPLLMENFMEMEQNREVESERMKGRAFCEIHEEGLERGL